MESSAVVINEGKWQSGIDIELQGQLIFWNKMLEWKGKHCVWGCLPCFVLFNSFTASSFVSHSVVVFFFFLPGSVLRRRISRPKLLLFGMEFCVRVHKKLEFKQEAVSHK